MTFGKYCMKDGVLIYLSWNRAACDYKLSVITVLLRNRPSLHFNDTLYLFNVNRLFFYCTRMIVTYIYQLYQCSSHTAFQTRHSIWLWFWLRFWSQFWVWLCFWLRCRLWFWFRLQIWLWFRLWFQFWSGSEQALIFFVHVKCVSNAPFSQQYNLIVFISICQVTC